MCCLGNRAVAPSAFPIVKGWIQVSRTPALREVIQELPVPPFPPRNMTFDKDAFTLT